MCARSHRRQPRRDLVLFSLAYVHDNLRTAPPDAKSTQQGGASLHRAQMTACTLRQMAEVTSAEVRQGVLLEVSPDVLDRVEFGCIGGQELKDDGTTLRLHMLAHE